MASRLPEYPADHPVAIALAGIARGMRSGRNLLDALAEQATAAGVRPWSSEFDEAAELAGLPYCRQLDLYVDEGTKRRADALHFTEAHLALI